MVKVGKSNDVTKHRSVWVNARGIMFEINSAEIPGTKFFTQRACRVARHSTLNYDVAASAV